LKDFRRRDSEDYGDFDADADATTAILPMAGEFALHRVLVSSCLFGILPLAVSDAMG
jgi:hypothetical protein